MKIKEKIKELREEKEKSQYQVSRELNIARYTYANWEQGRSEPSINDLEKLSNYFSCSVDYLLGLEDDLGIKKTPTINYREEKLLRAFNKLNDAEKDKIIEDCEFFANLHKEKV